MDEQKAKPTSIWTPSNIITMLRILLVPVFVAALLAPWPEWFGPQWEALNDWKSVIAAGIFVLISGTDWIDGYLARSRNEVTDFGKFMDPLADKILVAAALICLVELGSLPAWVVLIILAREFIVSGVRMLAATKGVVIAASMLGKFKTVFQMIAIVLFTIKDSHMVGSFGEAISDAFWDLSWLIMIIALILTIASMCDYLLKGRELFGFNVKGADHAGAIAELDTLVDDENLNTLAARVVKRASEKRVRLSTAESLTGGAIGAAITAIPGSSEVLCGGVISYAIEAKRSVLGVDSERLRSHGAVDEQVVKEMAIGSQKLFESDIAVAVSGIAGPAGAEEGKPVGTVWMSLRCHEESAQKRFQFLGDRDAVREQTVRAALLAIDEALDGFRPDPR